MKKLRMVLLLMFLALFLAAAAFAASGDIWSIRNQEWKDILRMTGDENLVLGASTVRIVKELFPYASAADTDSLLGLMRADSLTGTVMEHQPDCGARTVRMFLRLTAAVPGYFSGTIGVYGYNAITTWQNETFTITNDAVTQFTEGESGIVIESSKAFLLVDYVIASASLRDSLTYAESFSLGWGDTLGLSCRPVGDTIIAFIDTNNVATTDSPTGLYHALNNTYSPASALSGACVQVIYKSQELGVKP